MRYAQADNVTTVYLIFIVFSFTLYFVLCARDMYFMYEINGNNTFNTNIIRSVH